LKRYRLLSNVFGCKLYCEKWISWKWYN
jgi:hypothetical protein